MIDTESLPKDPVMATKWYKKAAEGGNKRACAALGVMYSNGDGVVQSFHEAKYWLELAGDDARALLDLGRLYRDGKGVRQDKAKALELFCQSAEQEYPHGLAEYGMMLYREGRFEEALQKFEAGARLENHLSRYREAIAFCQHQTACCLYMKVQNGSGDAGDLYPSALFWARKAVKNGREESKSFLVKLESIAHSKCRNCGKVDPKLTCSKCRGASYCDKSCQRTAWKSGHKAVCNGLPKLLSPSECAQCGKFSPKPRFMCQGCEKAYYCDETCQKRHWDEEHKDECKFL